MLLWVIVLSSILFTSLNAAYSQNICNYYHSNYVIPEIVYFLHGNGNILPDVTSALNMADVENTNRQVDKKNMSFNIREKLDIGENMPKLRHQDTSESGKGTVETRTTSEYCEKLQGWMWQYYTAYVNWQSWLAVSASPYFAPQPMQPLTAPVWPADFPNFDAQNWYNNPFGLPLSTYPTAIPAAGIPPGETAGSGAVSTSVPANQQPQQNGNAQRPGSYQRHRCCYYCICLMCLIL